MSPTIPPTKSPSGFDLTPNSPPTRCPNIFHTVTLTNCTAASPTSSHKGSDSCSSNRLIQRWLLQPPTILPLFLRDCTDDSGTNYRSYHVHQVADSLTNTSLRI
eukprot:m.175712 g.175712  ORF g.175712 m.175712 type:complete len:104 (-) comp31828_c0_seq24:902-1213(-)